MGSHQDRCSALFQVADKVQNFTDQLWIQRGGDLVQEQHFRVHRYRANNCGALLLATRNLVGI